MPLTIVTGLPGSGRQALLIDRMAEKARAGTSALLILPTTAMAAQARAAGASSSPVGLRVATFDGVVRNQWASRGDGRTILEGWPADVFAAEALAAAGVAERPGRGAVALLRAISERQAAIGADLPSSVPGLSGRLVRALAHYRATLVSHGLVEMPEAVRRLSASHPPADSIGLVGLRSLNPAAEHLINAWGDRAEVTLELPWAPRHAATEAIQGLIDRLVDAGAYLQDAGGLQDDRPAELAHIVERLFSGASPRPAEGSVRLGLAQGAEGEAALAARFASDLICRGVDPGSIAITFPDLSRHRGWVEHALREIGIPAAVDLEASVTQTPFGRALLRLWAFWSGGMRREDLMAFLRSGFAGIALAEVDRIDARARSIGATDGTKVLMLAGPARALLERCNRLTRGRIDAGAAYEWKSLADSLMALAFGGDAPRLQSDARFDAAAHRQFCTMLDQALETGAVELTVEQLMDSFASTRVRVDGSPRSGCVSVTSLDGLAGRDVEHLIIGGLTAGEFPRRGSEERMQGDAVGRVVAALGVSPDPSEHARSERLAFYLAATAPTRSLALVRQETDDDGAAVRGSIFWDEFLDLYREPAEGEWPAGAPDPERIGAVAHRCTTKRAGRGALTGAARPLLRTSGPVSASAIERYAGCPYRWFIESKLAARTPDAVFDRAAAGTLAHETLALFHKRLRLHAERVTPDNVEWALREVAECYREAVADARAHPIGLEEQRLQADVLPAVERIVRLDATFLPGFVPLYAEWAFGPGSDAELDIAGTPVKGRADRIDVGPDGIVIVDYKLSSAHPLAKIEKNRLLQLQLYAHAASARLGLPIVGGLYRNLKTGESRGFMRAEHGAGFVSNDVIDAERLDALIGSSIETAAAAIAGMLDGDITPVPDKDRCAYCPGSAFCGVAVM